MYYARANSILCATNVRHRNGARGLITMSKGLDFKKKEELMRLELTIYAISLSALKKLARLARLDLREVKAGILLEMIVGYAAEAKVEAKLGPKLTIGASTGRKTIKPFVYRSVDPILWPPGVALDIGAGLKDIQNTDGPFDTTFIPGDFLTGVLGQTIKSSVFVYWEKSGLRCFGYCSN
jgi:hypothetical protein